MKLFAALLIIVFLAFSGYHLSFRRIKLPLFARTFYITGIEYLFLGLLLGPHFLNLLDVQTLAGLEPFSALLLGWVGLLCGFQFELSGIRKFPRSFLFSSFIDIMGTFIVVFTGLYILLPRWFDISGPNLIIIITGFAAAATSTAQTGLALLTSDIIKKRSHLVNYLRYLSSMNAMGALILLSAVFLFNPSPSRLPTSGFFLNITPATLLSVVVANMTLIVLYNLFLAKPKEKKELSLLLIGMVIITSGAASSLRFSPLLANFVMGAVLVNTRREKERIFGLLVLAEKPLYLLLLVFLGATWNVDNPYIIPLALGLMVLRFTGKISSGYLASRVHHATQIFPKRLGLGLLEQGGVPLAIYFDLSQSFPTPLMNHLVGIAITALVIGDMISPHLIDNLVNPSPESGAQQNET